MANKVVMCGVNTSQLPRYKDHEMVEMMNQIKAGDSGPVEGHNGCNRFVAISVFLLSVYKVGTHCAATVQVQKNIVCTVSVACADEVNPHEKKRKIVSTNDK